MASILGDDPKKTKQRQQTGRGTESLVRGQKDYSGLGSVTGKVTSRLNRIVKEANRVGNNSSIGLAIPEIKSVANDIASSMKESAKGVANIPNTLVSGARAVGEDIKTLINKPNTSRDLSGLAYGNDKFLQEGANRVFERARNILNYSPKESPNTLGDLSTANTSFLQEGASRIGRRIYNNSPTLQGVSSIVKAVNNSRNSENRPVDSGRGFEEFNNRRINESLTRTPSDIATNQPFRSVKRSQEQLARDVNVGLDYISPKAFSTATRDEILRATEILPNGDRRIRMGGGDFLTIPEHDYNVRLRNAKQGIRNPVIDAKHEDLIQGARLENAREAVNTLRAQGASAADLADAFRKIMNPDADQRATDIGIAERQGAITPEQAFQARQQLGESISQKQATIDTERIKSEGDQLLAQAKEQRLVSKQAQDYKYRDKDGYNKLFRDTQKILTSNTTEHPTISQVSSYITPRDLFSLFPELASERDKARSKLRSLIDSGASKEEQQQSLSNYQATLQRLGFPIFAIGNDISQILD